MGIKEQVNRATARALTIASAATGLSSCEGCIGIVGDPVPSPLKCDSVAKGQTLRATGVLTEPGLVSVEVTQTEMFDWEVNSVVAVSGGRIEGLVPPQHGSTTPGVLGISLSLNPGSNKAEFTVSGRISDLDRFCDFSRQFSVSIDDGSGTVTVASAGELPLPSRQHADIQLVIREGEVVTLRVHTDYQGKINLKWSVSAGEVTADQGNAAIWRLPQEPGIYLAEVVLDFGQDGIAYDALALEVS